MNKSHEPFKITKIKIIPLLLTNAKNESTHVKPTTVSLKSFAFTLVNSKRQHGEC